MKKIAVILFTVFSITTAHAFDYHGIKSGMTKAEVSEVLKGLGATQDKYNQVDLMGLAGMIKDKKLKDVNESPIMMSFTYNYEDRLYKLQLNYLTDQTGPRGLGLKQALEAKFGAEVTEGRLKLYSTSIDNTVAILIDEKMVKSAIAHHKSKYMGEL